jgi:DNA-binding CsgD family transcriptional regulator
MATTQLTRRQQEVLDLWLAGTQYRELAAELGIAPGTVNPHLKAIAKKLNATGISREALGVALSCPVG